MDRPRPGAAVLVALDDCRVGADNRDGCRLDQGPEQTRLASTVRANLDWLATEKKAHYIAVIKFHVSSGARSARSLSQVTASVRASAAG